MDASTVRWIFGSPTFRIPRSTSRWALPGWRRRCRGARSEASGRARRDGSDPESARSRVRRTAMWEHLLFSFRNYLAGTASLRRLNTALPGSGRRRRGTLPLPGRTTPASDPGEPMAIDELRAMAVRERLGSALFEIRRVIAGQDAMLERVLVCLLARGHLLIEGVPGLAKTLTIKTTAAVLGGSFQRVQFTPDLVPSDLVGTRVYRPDSGSFETETGPVFCNFLLADEINRAPAKVQSALLEVMQERQVTIGRTTYPVPQPFLVMATQNPIESEGTYPLPEAQVDRFMLKILVDYPLHDEQLAVVERSLGEPPELRLALTLDELREAQAAALEVYV